MLRLYLDANEGAGHIPCPKCGRALLLGMELSGRWLVGYRGGFRIPRGARTMLVCPDYDCDHEETVEIVRQPADAVVFSPVAAAGSFWTEAKCYDRNLDETQRELDRVEELERRTGSLKLRSAVKFWKERLSLQISSISSHLEMGRREGREVVCLRHGGREQGLVQELRPDGVLLAPSGGETFFLPAGEIISVMLTGSLPRPERFDFAGLNPPGRVAQPISTPRRYVVVAGYPLVCDVVTRYGLCRVHTSDPAAAESLGLHHHPWGDWRGEVPVGLVGRAYRLVRYAWVQGFRLYLESITRDPAVFVLGTRDMLAARTLGMHRALTWVGQRKALRWERQFSDDEIGRWEEVQVPIVLPRRPRR